MINYSATFAITFLLSLYLQYIKGLDADQAGLILVAQPLVMTILSPYTGKLSDRIEPRLVATAGMALTFGAVSAFIFLGQDTSIYFIVASLLILGLGLSLFTSPNTNAIMSSVEPRFVLAGDGELLQELRGKASSLSNVFFPGWLDQDQITVLLKHSHIGVCPSGQIENKVFFLNKAFSYLAEGLPILSSFRGEIEEIIDTYKVGYSYNNVESLVKGIKALYDNSDLYREMSANALSLFGQKLMQIKYMQDMLNTWKESRNVITKGQFNS